MQSNSQFFSSISQFHCQLALILVPELWIPNRMVTSQATFRNVVTVSELSIKPGEVRTVELMVKLPGTMRLVNHPVAIRMVASDSFTPFSFGELALMTRFGTVGPSNCIKVIFCDENIFLVCEAGSRLVRLKQFMVPPLKPRNTVLHPFPPSSVSSSNYVQSTQSLQKKNY